MRCKTGSTKSWCFVSWQKRPALQLLPRPLKEHGWPSIASLNNSATHDKCPLVMQKGFRKITEIKAKLLHRQPAPVRIKGRACELVTPRDVEIGRGNGRFLDCPVRASGPDAGPLISLFQILSGNSQVRSPPHFSARYCLILAHRRLDRVVVRPFLLNGAFQGLGEFVRQHRDYCLPDHAGDPRLDPAVAHRHSRQVGDPH